MVRDSIGPINVLGQNLWLDQFNLTLHWQQ